jgi:hypothetical protein
MCNNDDEEKNSHLLPGIYSVKNLKRRVAIITKLTVKYTVNLSVPVPVPVVRSTGTVRYRYRVPVQ